MMFSSTKISWATWQMRRSARRQTVRQTCAWAAAAVPPGRRNAWSGGTVASSVSMRFSIRAMSSGQRRLASRSCVKIGADDKEFILNEEEQGVVFGSISCLSKETYVGIEFIDGSIGFEPRIVFGGTLSSY